MHKLLLCIFLASILYQPTSVQAVTVPCINNCPDLAPGTTSGDWPMVGANLQRTSWNTEAVRNSLNVDWYTPINNVQGGTGAEVKMISSEPIAAGGKIFVAKNIGLFAFNSDTGALSWFYGTEMPFGGNPTYSNGTLYIGGYDKRVHAINATDGKLKTGWTFVDAGAGYETNPLVVNNRVYLGNRDGYMYCLDATTGALVWKWRDATDEWPDSPIRFSAAYKNGILYWGQDNAHAYAIRDDGTSASLVWKSAKMPGVGFTSYWTVLYHDKTLNKDYVLLSGSKKTVTAGWFDGDHYFSENYEIFSGASFGTLVGALGNIPGAWISGTVTIDATKIQQEFNTKPQKRHLFVLDATTGTEFTPYAPVNWVSATHGGDKRPPLISGLDGVIYTHIGYQYGPDANTYPNMGASGCISGWKFGTQYISRICDFARGFADETVHFTGGGEKIYWSEGFNMGYGSVDTNKVYHSNNQIDYAGCGCMWNCLGIPSSACGGGTSPMIPYKDRLYMIEGKSLIAFKSGGAMRANAAANPTTASTPPVISIQPQIIQQRLETEVSKIVNLNNILRPGFMDSGFWGLAVNSGYIGTIYGGDHLTDYYHTPYDTIFTLSLAYPHLSPNLKNQVIIYLKNNFGVGKTYDLTKYAHIGWKNGLPREIYDDTPELQTVIQRPNDDTNSNVASIPRTTSYNPEPNVPKLYTFPQDAFYGAWKYVQLVPSDTTTVWNAIKGKLETPVADSMLITYPFALNQYINGYTGYIELAKLVGGIDTTAQQTTLNHLINLRLNNFNLTDSFPADYAYNRTLLPSRHFMYLTPELANIFKNPSLLPQVQSAVAGFTTDRPYWFVTKYDQTPGEGVFDPLYTYQSLYLTKAWVLQQSYDELVKYLDVPAFWRGDLFYIQTLVAALQANTSPIPLQADFNNDGVVDYRDFFNFIPQFNQSNTTFKLLGTGIINLFDFNKLVSYLFK